MFGSSPRFVDGSAAIDLVEVVRPKHFGDDFRMLVAQVHELELTTEQVHQRNDHSARAARCVIAEQVKSRADSPDERVIA